jgi:hypothetical protein
MTETIRISFNLSELDRCPQCGVAKPLLVFEHAIGDPLEATANAPIWICYRCTSCHNLVGIKTLGQLQALKLHPGAGMIQQRLTVFEIIPDLQVVDSDLPEKPRRYLSQAIASLHAPDGAVMLAGSAIDAMLKLKGLEAGSVYARIEKAVEQNILTKDMSDWAHAVRLEANKPRHADMDDPHATEEMARLTIEFTRALGDFLFVLPARVAKGRAEAERASKRE